MPLQPFHWAGGQRGDAQDANERTSQSLWRGGRASHGLWEGKAVVAPVLGPSSAFDLVLFQNDNVPRK